LSTNEQIAVLDGYSNGYAFEKIKECGKLATEAFEGGLSVAVAETDEGAFDTGGGFADRSEAVTAGGPLELMGESLDGLKLVGFPGAGEFGGFLGHFSCELGDQFGHIRIAGERAFDRRTLGRS